jgi:hypothetical protein
MNNFGFNIFFLEKPVMHEMFRNFTCKLVILLSLASGAACGSANAKADESPANLDAKSLAKQNKREENLAQQTKLNLQPEISAVSVAGSYEYNTVKKGTGYVNSLTVEDKGAGMLHVSLSGSYVYQANGAETFHEASGEGDAKLMGSSAVANITDEDDKICRVTINFMANQAAVKVPAACHFNVALDGVYKKEKPDFAEEQASKPSKAKLTEVAFENLADFLNDFDKHQPGERFTVRDVPVAKIEGVWRADADGKKDYKGLFSMDFNNGGADGSGTFLASKALVRNVQGNGNSETASVRVTAALIETSANGDYSRSVFVVKVEGLDKNGELIWTAEGDEPAKVSFRN